MWCAELSLDSARFSLDMRLSEPRVTLRGHDGRMTEDLLQRGQRSSCLQPATGERMPELVDMEACDPGPAANLLVEPIGARDGQHAPNSEPQLLEQRRRQGHSSHLPELGLVNHDQAATGVQRLKRTASPQRRPVPTNNRETNP